MNYKHFSIEERELLQYMWWERKSVRSMAKALNRSPSSVSRELKRNFPPEYERYSPHLAHQRALAKRKSRGRYDRLKNNHIRQYVVLHLKEGWSPEQISGRIKFDLNEKISHEAIYQYVYSQVYREGYGYLKPGGEDLRQYLRRRRKHRMKKGARKVQRWSVSPGLSIDERPAIVASRSRLGDWESDSVESRDHKPGLNTLVERKTGLVCMTKLPDKSSYATSAVVIKRLSSLPHHTVTFDNGPENKDWRRIESDLSAQCFFTHPYCSGERGTNENTNGLIREYFPKKTDFSTIPQEQVTEIEYKLNTRPRKRLNYLTPLEAFSVAVEG